MAAGMLAAAVSAGAQTPFDAPKRTDLSSPVVVIPLVKEGGFYYADVRMNGREYRFTLETGAGFFGISNRAARELGVVIDSVELMPGSRAPVAKIDSLSVGGVTFYGLAARVSSTFDDAGFDGIISVSLLRDLLATLDLGRSQLRLERGALPPTNGRDVMDIAGLDRGGRIDVWMDFAGVRAPAVLDTRSFLWIVIPDSLEGRLRFEGSPRSIGEARGPSLGVFQLRGARLVGNAHIGNAVLQQPVLTLRNRAGTVLGVPLLEQFEVTIDQRNRRVRFTRPSGTPVIVPALAWETNAPAGGGDEPSRRVVSAAPPPVAGQRTMGFNLAGAPGADQLRVLNVAPGSSAEKEGLKNGDALVEFDGIPVVSMSASVMRAAAQRGGPVKVIVMREGKAVALLVLPHPAP